MAMLTCLAFLPTFGEATAATAPVVMTEVCVDLSPIGQMYFPVSGTCGPDQRSVAVDDPSDALQTCYLHSNGKIRAVDDPSECTRAPRSKMERSQLVPSAVALYFCASDEDGTLFFRGTSPVACPSEQFAVVVEQANPPIADSRDVTLLEDHVATFAITGSDPDAEPITFAVTSLPAHGQLFEGASTDAGDLIATVPTTIASAGTSATVTYLPDLDAHGSDAFQFTTSDAFTDSAAATVSISITPVNDAPGFVAGAAQEVSEDAGPQSVAGWASAVGAGPANESGQAVTFQVAGNTNPGLFSAGPSVDPAGTLTYTPAVDAFGSATVEVRAMDDGGTANGGVDTSPPQTLTITVTPVNDAPSFDLPTSPDQSLAPNAGAQTVPGFATNISAGPPNEAGQTLTFDVSNDNAALFGIAPDIDESTGDLTYTPATDAIGVAEVSVVLTDDGGTAGGGSDTSATATFMISIAPPNSAPVAEDQSGAGAVTLDEDTVTNITLTATDADDDDLTFSIVTGPSSGSLGVIGPADCTTIAGTCTADVEYTPNANANGTDSFTFRADDGVLVSAVATVDLVVTPVNDPPVAVDQDGGDVQTHMKRVAIDAGLLTGVTDADGGVGACTPTYQVASITSSSGGTVSNVNLAAGTFDFEPAPGFTGTAIVNFTVSDDGCPGSAESAPAQISLTVAGPVIWFVDPSAAAGNGTMASPFSTLSAAAAADAGGHRIFLFSGTASTGISLQVDEWLIGQGVTGASFDAVFGITPPAGTVDRPTINGTRPVVQGTVAMTTGDAVRGLDVQPPAGVPGVTAAGATGLTVGEVSVTAAGAAAVDLTGGSSGTLSFTSVDADGGAVGIVLTDLNAGGGSFTVTGTGAPGSGGTVQNTTGNGISISNAAGIELRGMIVRNAGDDGINGTSVSGFTLNGVSVTGNGNSLTDEGIELVNPAGAIVLTNVTATGNAHGNLLVDDADNTGGSSTLTISGGSYSSSGAEGHGALVELDGPAVLGTSSISGATFEDNGVMGLQVVANGASSISDLTVSDNTFGDTGSANVQEVGLDVAKSGTSNVSVKVLNNTVIGHRSHGMNFFSGVGTTGTYSARISDNTVGTAAPGSGSAIGNCVRVNINGDADATVLVSNNTLRQCPNGRGLEVIGRNGIGGLDVTITGNDVDPQDTSGFPLAAIFVQSNCATVCNTVRSDIRNNVVPVGTAADLLPTYIAVVESPASAPVSTSELVNTTGSASCTAQLVATNTGSAAASVGCALIAGPIATPS